MHTHTALRRNGRTARRQFFFTKIEIDRRAARSIWKLVFVSCRRALSRPSFRGRPLPCSAVVVELLAMECRRAEEPFEPRPQSCLRFGISTLLVGALCIAVGLSYKGFAVSKEDAPSATMTVSGMLYYDDTLSDCPYEMSNVTVNFYGDSHPSPEVKKSPYGDPITIKYTAPEDRKIAIDQWLKSWICPPAPLLHTWLPDEMVTVMFWKPHGVTLGSMESMCGEWILGPTAQCSRGDFSGSFDPMLGGDIETGRFDGGFVGGTSKVC